jgi:hypothetical protein
MTGGWPALVIPSAAVLSEAKDLSTKHRAVKLLQRSEEKMRIGSALFVALFLLPVSCAPPGPKSAATTAGDTVPQATPGAADQPPSVIVTTDPQAVAGCRRIGRTEQGYDIGEPEQWRKLQDEAVRRGGNTVLATIEGDRTAEIFSCSKR